MTPHASEDMPTTGRLLMVRSAVDADSDMSDLVTALAEGLTREGHQVGIVHPEGETVGGGLASYPLAIQGGPGAGAESAAVRRLSDLAAEYDVIHAFGMRAAAYCALALSLARAAGRPPAARLVVTLHQPVYGATADESFLNTALGRIVVDAADHIFCVSQDIQNFVEGLGHVAVSRAVIPELWAATRTSTATGTAPPATQEITRLRREAGVAQGRFMALVATELQPRKCVDMVIDAMGDPKVRDMWHLVVVGDGPHREHLQRQAERLLPAARPPVTWIASHHDLPRLIAASDALLVTSQWEGKPQAVQHALRVGTPVVATCSGGIPELVGAEYLFSAEGVVLPRTTQSYDINGAAMLIAVDDEGAVRDSLRDLESLPLRVRLSELGRSRALHLETLDEALAQVTGVYEAAFARRAATLAR
ncbi:glycosyltransferase family 4 protein [Micrococcales bacterium 31B]|nr:glycosyltransferase family 4 protein [Micrococcales bacterium 31B]